MIYAFIIDPVAITVRYWEERWPDAQVEAGARVEVRRVTAARGERDRPGAAGWHIGPVSDDGVWRADLLELIAPSGNEPRYHHHPQFRNADVGPRAFDPDMTADPVGWTMARLTDLPALLELVGSDDLARAVDGDALARALPAMRTAITECMAQVNARPAA